MASFYCLFTASLSRLPYEQVIFKNGHTQFKERQLTTNWVSDWKALAVERENHYGRTECVYVLLYYSARALCHRTRAAVYWIVCRSPRLLSEPWSWCAALRNAPLCPAVMGHFSDSSHPRICYYRRSRNRLEIQNVLFFNVNMEKRADFFHKLRIFCDFSWWPLFEFFAHQQVFYLFCLWWLV